MRKNDQTKPVRFYFEIGIPFALPDVKQVNAVSDDECFNDVQRSLCEEIQASLPSDFDDVGFLHAKKIPRCKNLSVIYFSVSKIHEFSPHEIHAPTEWAGVFQVLSDQLLQAEKSTEQEIRSSLSWRYHIKSLRLQHIASRSFIFELYFGGSIIVERIFEPEEISEAGGVQDALDSFFDEVYLALRDSSMDGDALQTARRRNRKNQYVFEVSATCYFGFNEREVVGLLALANREMSPEELHEFAICTDDSAVESLIPEVQSTYRASLEITLPPNAELLQFDFDYIDQNDDVFDLQDELRMRH